MLYYTQSQHTKANLAALRSLVSEPLSSVFERELFIIESSSIEPLIHQAVTAAAGVSAHTEFLYPADFFWRVFDALKSPESSAAKAKHAYNPYHPARLQYYIFSMLLNQPETHPFSSEDICSKWNISNDLAILFDAYSKQNSEWFYNDKSPLQQSWQGDFFVAVKGHIKVHTGQDFWLDGAAHFAQNKLDAASIAPLLPARIIVFQPEQLSRPYISFLDQLAVHIDVHIFNVKSSQVLHQYSDAFMLDSETEASHTQLSLSQLTHYRNHRLAQQMELDLNEHVQSPITWRECASQAISQPSYLLTRLKQQLMHAADAEHYDDDAVIQDDSINIVSCHSRLREVEVMRDYLYQLFSQQPELSYQDVLITAADMPSYEGLIASVFTGEHSHADTPHKSHPEHAHINIDINAYDAALSMAQQFVNQSLALSQHYFSPAQMLQLLSLPIARHALSLSQRDLDTLSHWFVSLPVLQARHANIEAWQHAIKRLAIGVMTQEQSMISNALPYPNHTANAVNLIGRVAEFINHLAALHRPRSQHELGVHFEHFNAYLNYTVLKYARETDIATEAVTAKLQLIRAPLRAQLQVMQHMLTMVQQTSGATSAELKNNDVDQLEPLQNGPVMDEGMLALWSDQLFAQCKNNTPSMSHALQLRSMAQAASMPAKVRIMLGMNEADYPPKQVPSALDLRYHANNQAHAGSVFNEVDRARHHFVQSLYNTDQQLYISYLGKTIDKNEARPPSILVSELLRELNVVVNQTHKPIESWIKQQPLHAHDYKYLAAADWPRYEPALFNVYLQHSDSDDVRQASAHEFYPKSLWNEMDDTALLTPSTMHAQPKSSSAFYVDQLAQMLQSPVRDFVRDQLGMRVYLPDALTEQSAWQAPTLKYMTQRHYQHGLHQGLALDELIDCGLIADDVMGRAQHKTQLSASHQHWHLLNELQQHSVFERHTYEQHALGSHGIEIMGSYQLLRSAKAFELLGISNQDGAQALLLQHKLSEPYSTEMLGFWLQHLFYHASTGKAVETLILMPQQQGGGRVSLKPIEDIEHAKGMAKELCEITLTQPQPLVFDAKLAKKAVTRGKVAVKNLYGSASSHTAPPSIETDLLCGLDDFAQSDVFVRLTELTYLQYDLHKQEH